MHKEQKTVQRYRIIIGAAALLLSLEAEGQGLTDIGRLTRENAALEGTIDSLKLVILKMERQDRFVSTWDDLHDLEGDVHSTDGMNFFGLSADASDASFMKKVIAAAPLFEGMAYDPSVRDHVKFYSVTKHRNMSAILARYDHFFPYFKAIFNQAGVPEDLIALSIVESAVSRTAVSSAGASGMWQFMKGTAQDYGLRVGEGLDERFDILLSTRAAAKYLKNLYGSLGSWEYAVLAYNCGPGKVREAIIRSGKSDNIWDVMRFLPKETQGYLPSLLAARYVLRYRDQLDIAPRKWNEPEISARTYAGVTLERIAAETGYDLELIKKLNPHLTGDYVPRSGAAVYLPR